MKDNDRQKLEDNIPLDAIDLSDEKKHSQPEPIITKKVESEPVEGSKKSHRKLFVVLISLAVIMSVATFMVWLFVFKGIYAFQGLPLSSFSNSYYSLKIPEGYTKSENDLDGSGTDISFSDLDEKTVGTQSKVYVMSGNMPVDQKNRYFSDLDKKYTDSYIKKSQSAAGVNGAADIRYSKHNQHGFPARTISYDITTNSNRVGRYDKMSIYKNGKIYEIVITSPRSNPGLAVDAKKIFDSFEIK